MIILCSDQRLFLLKLHALAVYVYSSYSCSLSQQKHSCWGGVNMQCVCVHLGSIPYLYQLRNWPGFLTTEIQQDPHNTVKVQSTQRMDGLNCHQWSLPGWINNLCSLWAKFKFHLKSMIQNSNFLIVTKLENIQHCAEQICCLFFCLDIPTLAKTNKSPLLVHNFGPFWATQ